MEDKKYEFVVVGSGAGGATLARELTLQLLKVKDGILNRKGTLESALGRVALYLPLDGGR